MGWRIQGGSVDEEFAALGLDRLSINRLNQQAGTASWVQSGNYAADALFAEGADITIRRPDGVRVFFGRLLSVRRRGSGESEEIVYSAADPWVWLDRVTYQQNWNEAEDPGDPESALQARLRSRILLGLDPAGAKQNTGEAIEEVLQFAIDSGAPFQIGEIDPAQDVPIDEQRDLTCAEAVRRLLRWHPDVSSWFDFSGSGNPVLHLRRRSNGPLVELSAEDAQQVGAGGELLSDLNLTARTDLVVPEVVIKYEIANQTDSRTWYNTSVDAAPGSADGRAFGALVGTVELGGFRASFQSQFVGTQDIDASNIEWWRSKLPALEDVSDLTIEDHDVDPEQPREVVSGAVPEWLSASAEDVVVTAVASYTYTDAETGAEYARTEQVSVTLTGTSLTTDTYSQLVSFTPAEPVPEGLAAALLAGLSHVHFEGTIEVEGAEASGAYHPGMRVNISGSRSEYADMEAVVQGVQIDVDAGTTRLTLGPPEHLGPQDLAELLRVTRTRQTSYLISTRVSGEFFGVPTSGPRASRADNASAGRSVPAKLTVAAGTGAQVGKIILDAGDELLAGKEIKIFEEDWCEGEGQPTKKVLILRSEPYTPD